MSYAADLEGSCDALELDQLPPELREQARAERRSQGGYRYDSDVDRQHIKEQRAAIWAWFRGLGGNLIKHGVNLTKVPLPVELCEPRSFLQRLTDSWCYLELLHAAAAASDPVERMKLVMAFAVGGIRQQVSCDKPFNPILGETLQGSFPCGCSVHAEQVSHHPPISCWQLLDHAGQFEFTGSSCWSATFTGNSVKGTQTGESRVRFASDGAAVTWRLPTIYIRGVLFGDRVVKYHDTITFEDAQHNLRCELSLDPHAPKRGLVKRLLNKARHPRHKHGHDQLVGDLVRLVPGAKGGEQVLDSCSGSWLTELTWDKGVRSTIVPAGVPGDSTASAAEAQLHAGQPADADAACVGCHSIGSFSSSTSSSAGSDAGGDDAAGQQLGAAAANGTSGRGSSSSSSDAGGSSQHAGASSSGLTATTLAQHASRAAAAGANSVVPAPAGPSAAHEASCATMTSSDATGHRSGRGIGVTKQLWSASSSQVIRMTPLADDDPGLLPSDCRYRPDIQALGGGDRSAAQHWKLVLEQRQRADRALREQGTQGRRHSQHHQHHSSAEEEACAGAQ